MPFSGKARYNSATMKVSLTFPVSEREIFKKLRAGDFITIRGKILAARDQTHRLLLKLLEEEAPLPVSLEGQLVYYVGPSPAPPGRPVGAAGPTTSYRMDAYTPALLAQGVAATMGKGKRSPEVREAHRRFNALYLATFGGAGAYLSRCIKEARVLAFPELGPEALFEFEVEDFPAVVINDLYGADFYEEAQRTWQKILQSEGLS